MRSLVLIYTSVKQHIISDMIKQMPLLQLMAVIQLSINCKFKQDLPVSWSLIKILWVAGREQGSHMRYACAPPHSEMTYRSHNQGRAMEKIISLLANMHTIKYITIKVGTWLPCSRPVTRRILIKLQLTGKSRLILQFYFVASLCHKEITWDLKACDQKKSIITKDHVIQINLV